MQIVHQNVVTLLEYVKIDSFNVVCHFKCKETNKSITSIVAFEPYDGKIEFTWLELFLHPFASYNKYYHTPITIYSNDTHDTIVLKAFSKVADRFSWNDKLKKYIFCQFHLKRNHHLDYAQDYQ